MKAILRPVLPPVSDALLNRLAAAVPDLLLAVGFLVTWLAPATFGERAVAYLMLVMLLEFLIVHSAGLMGAVVFNEPLSPRTKARSLFGLGAFYTLFAAAFAVGFRAWWPLWTIWLLTLNRLLLMLTGEVPAGRERAYIRRGWAVSGILYLLFAGLTAVLPVPAFGLTDAVVRAQDLPGSGLWIDQPHRVIAFGFLYFLGVGLSEMFSHAWLSDQHLPAADESSEASL